MMSEKKNQFKDFFFFLTNKNYLSRVFYQVREGWYNIGWANIQS